MLKLKLSITEIKYRKVKNKPLHGMTPVSQKQPTETDPLGFQFIKYLRQVLQDGCYDWNNLMCNTVVMTVNQLTSVRP